MRHLLITGGCGFIGVNLIRYLLSPKSGFTGVIINIDKLTYASQPHALVEMPTDRYHFIQGDISDLRLVEQILQEYSIDTICHLAAESHVDRSINAPSAFMQSNVMGTFTILEAIRQNNPHIYLHHVSTDEVFGSLHEDEPAFTEQSPYHPNNPYSASKASSDHLVWAYRHTYGLPITMSHATNNYGAYQHQEKFIPRMLAGLLQRKSLPLYGDGSHLRDWLHVEDHVRAIWCILQMGKIGESYNIGANNPYSNKDLLHLLCQIVANQQTVPVEDLYALITPVADRLGHDYRYAIDAKKIEVDLGWRAQINFQQGITNYVRWFIETYPH
ncbi:dTDP-glucose 4,6-dehydratase [Spirochaetales bacterium BR151]|uniref:dTDP-glucose 4,6-dehydratase n=1 Tax=Entomospira culicis TaxID=2719989 RepID=A0A968KTQ7_9SPIO|nr:dTDP-glucose 4,6-dehydratase [Entomospira culicis]NIZ68704.1 dTDP-glucose 4,6-dehydratase [Entomospira culicis]